jgi:hypothetical protein
VVHQNTQDPIIVKLSALPAYIATAMTGGVTRGLTAGPSPPKTGVKK